jgi:predicted nucleic acid-binding protein
MVTVLLDTGPLGMASNPRRSVDNQACLLWIKSLVRAGGRVIVPEIADYEVRRELLRARKTSGLRRLDVLSQSLEYLSITTPVMRQAAEFWAQARRTGRPTADDKALDGDVILAAQAVLITAQQAIVATTNVKHIAQFCSAAVWSDIRVGS